MAAVVIVSLELYYGRQGRRIEDSGCLISRFT